MAENTSGFQTAFDALTRLQEVQFSALRADVVELKADVKQLSARQDQTDELLEGMRHVVDLLTKFGDRKNWAMFGGAFSVLSFLTALIARLF